MKAMVIVPSDDGGTLELRDAPEPEPGPNELLVKVKAASINRADLAQRSGDHVIDLARGKSLQIAGLDAAGEVVDVGSAVTAFKPGDRVMAMVPGGFAEYVALDERLALPLPETLSWEEGAASVIALMTEYDAIVNNAKLAPGEVVLLHAAASGVGMMGVQIAAVLNAGLIVGTVLSDKEAAFIEEFGALPFNARSGDFASRVHELTDGRGADVVIDHVGGPYLTNNIECMAIRGRLVSVGRLGGTHGELDLEQLAYKRLQILGVTWRTRSVDEYATIIQGVIKDMLPALADQRIRTVIDKTFRLDEAFEAQAYMESGSHLGKLVLQM